MSREEVLPLSERIVNFMAYMLTALILGWIIYQAIDGYRFYDTWVERTQKAREINILTDH